MESCPLGPLVQPTLLLPSSLAELERILRGAAEGRIPDAVEGESPPFVLFPRLPGDETAARTPAAEGTRRVEVSEGRRGRSRT